MTDDELLPIFEHVSINDGDVVSVTMLDNTTNQEVRELLKVMVEFFASHNKANVLVVVLPIGGSISKLDDNDMHTSGWVRA